MQKSHGPPPPEDETAPVETPPPQRPPPEGKVDAAPVKTGSSTPPEDEEADVPPSDLLAERCVIGCALLDGEACAVVTAALEPGDFYLQAHQHIAQAVWAVVDAGHPVDEVSVAGELRGRKRLEKVGGVPYLALCGEAVPTTAHALRYAEIVKGKAIQRQVIEAADRIGKLARDNGKPPAEMVAEVKGLLEGITVKEKQVPIIFGDALSELIGEPEWLWQDWLPKGYLTVLIADPGLGKSSLALWIAANLGPKGTWPDGTRMPVATKTLYLDAEAMQGENLKRLRVWGYDRAHVGWVGEDGMQAIDLRRPGVLRAYCEAAVAAGCGLVVVDSLSQAAGGDERAEVLEPILTEAALAARDLGIAILVLHHLRKARQDEPAKVTIDRARGSSVVGQIARSLWAMWRPDLNDKTVRVEVIKANLAPTGQAFGLLWSEKALEFGEAPESPEKSPPTILGHAKEMVEAMLGAGPKTGGELETKAEELGIKRRTMYNALDATGARQVLVERGKRQVKCWALPEERFA